MQPLQPEIYRELDAKIAITLFDWRWLCNTKDELFDIFPSAEACAHGDVWPSINDNWIEAPPGLAPPPAARYRGWDSTAWEIDRVTSFKNNLPHYSTRMDDALLVQEAMRRRSFYLNLLSPDSPGESPWTASFIHMNILDWNHDTSNHRSAKAATPALAICLAALQTLSPVPTPPKPAYAK